MRFAVARLAVVLMAVLAASAVRAQTNFAALNPPSIAADIPLAPHVVGELLVRKFAPIQDPIETAWLTQLLAYYSAAGAVPAWIGPNGPLTRASMAMDELRRADDYALDPSRFNVAWISPDQSDLRTLADFEVRMSLAVARYAWHARGGRLEPTSLSLWLDYKPRPVNAAETIKAVVAAEDAGSALRALHPQHVQFEALRRAYLRERGGTPASDGRYRVNIPMGVRVKPGQRHSDVALARLRLDKPAIDGDDTLLDSDFQEALYDFMNGVAGIPYGRRRGLDDDVRVALNGGSRGGNRAMMDLIRSNMERWRWLPRELGDLYVWNNLPEFQSRVVRGGEIIHSEKIIIGQPSTQTPVFSDSIVRVIFNPDWNVPESIKLATIWPNLRGGDYGVLRRRGMRIVHEGKEVDPARLRYAELNARDVPVVMGPGPSNPLGRFKFVFPNKHDVYMHDTTSKGLFASRERTFSHGCIRVNDPQRFAEVVLAEAKGWNKADVRWQARAKNTVRIELDRQIPIHNTYFTLVADASGTLKKLTDVYGHDKRVTDALNGVDPKKIAERDPALALKKKNEELANGAVVGDPQKDPKSRKRSASKSRSAPVKSATPASASGGFLFFKPSSPAKAAKQSRQSPRRGPSIFLGPSPPPPSFFGYRSSLRNGPRGYGYF